MDADLLPLCSLDSLFELRVPAATFSSPWANSCKEDGYVDPYVVGKKFLTVVLIRLRGKCHLLLLLRTLWKCLFYSFHLSLMKELTFEIGCGIQHIP